MATKFKLPEDLSSCVANALAEDIGDGDISAALIPDTQQAHARVICRESAAISGLAWFDEVFRQLSDEVSIQWHIEEGDEVQNEQLLCELRGPARILLTGERSALNFLQTLSAVTTKTRQYIQQVLGTGATLLDTRKTLPGLRTAQKYAVACAGAGAENHRMGLYDAFLIKENHILAAGSISAAVQSARQLAADKPVEVEVENLEELQEALSAGAERILLDNFDLDQLRAAVSINEQRAQLEASGGVNLATLRDIALTGVNYISIGGLTKDVRAVDLSMRFEFHNG